MKKYYLLLLFVTSFVSAQIVNIPDANFKAKLLSADNTNSVATNATNQPMKIDINNDGEIQQSEALEVYTLNVSNSNIVDLIGIQFFTNLKMLFCNTNPLISLDTSGLLNLEELVSYNCSISNLNVNASLNLKNLAVYQNNLGTLNVSSLLSLKALHIDNNFLTTINLAGLTNLENFTCSSNLLPTLEVNDLTTLTYLSCANNLLTDLNVSSLINLTSLQMGNPGLNPVTINTLINLADLYFTGGIQTTIDISNLNNLSSAAFDSTNLIEIDASNNPNLQLFTFLENTNITFLNLKNGISYDTLVVTNCPNLLAICTNEVDIVSMNLSLQSQGINNVSITSYCSFTPGGNYNTITGSLKFDSDNNGCDATDLPQSNIKVTINDGSNQGATFTNNLGTYSFFTQAGNFTLTPVAENPSWFNFSPASATIPFANNNNNVVNQNFCLSANGIHPDLEVVIVPIIPARPGFDAVYKIVYKNKGNQTVTGFVNFTYNESVLDFVSSSVVPNNSGSGFLNWTLTNVNPFQSGSILVTLNVNSPQETPAVNNGDVLAFNAFIDVTTDDVWADNNFDFNQMVVGSYDPNDITCLEGNALPTADIGTYLHYNIRFENTGTAIAENIVVKNVIDLTQYNIETLQIMQSSHPMKVKVTGNIAEFIFEAIDLDTGGHGNILLKLKSNATIPENEVTTNAGIYFDYNFPVATNDEQTVFADLSKNNFTKDPSVQVYPNPTANVITVKAANTINSIELYDVQGRLLSTTLLNENSKTIDLSNYSAGVYFVNVTTVVGKETHRILKK